MAYNRNMGNRPGPPGGGNRRPGQSYSRPGGLQPQGPNANAQGFNRPGPGGPGGLRPGAQGPNAHMNSGGPGNLRPQGGFNQPGRLPQQGPNAHMNSGGPQNLGPRNAGPQSASPGQWAGNIRRVPQGGGGYGQNQQNPAMSRGRGGARRVGGNNALAGRMGNRRRY